jgi:hypothetical protein
MYETTGSSGTCSLGSQCVALFVSVRRSFCPQGHGWPLAAYLQSRTVSNYILLRGPTTVRWPAIARNPRLIDRWQLILTLLCRCWQESDCDQIRLVHTENLYTNNTWKRLSTPDSGSPFPSSYELSAAVASLSSNSGAIVFAGSFPISK